LLKQPHSFEERELDICLMKQTRRSIYRGGNLQFENLTYQSNDLAAYAGETVVLRYDPQDITQILVYRRESKPASGSGLAASKETFLATAVAQDLETERLSLREAKANSGRIRAAGKANKNRGSLNHPCNRSSLLNLLKRN
jgi:putative transposase